MNSTLISLTILTCIVGIDAFYLPVGSIENKDKMPITTVKSKDKLRKEMKQLCGTMIWLMKKKITAVKQDEASEKMKQSSEFLRKTCQEICQLYQRNNNKRVFLQESQSIMSKLPPSFDH